MKSRYFVALMVMMTYCFAASAQTAEDVDAMISVGDLSGAREAIKALPAKEAPLYEGRIAYMQYDFPEAERLYAKYRKTAGKNTSSDLDLYERQLTHARNAMENVEDIQVIDSIVVPMADFFKAYRLPHSAGSLVEASAIPFPEGSENAELAFCNEQGDYMIWGMPDASGVYRLAESIRLTDGTWQTPSFLPSSLAEGGDSDYPFMMSDGVTLYYASDGVDSMGGYDIFVATRDAATGEYLQPRNLGMPYNSPYDDYMLAIDELNGVGWWATDRNRLDGNITIYVFVVNDVRKNYDEDNEDLISFARLDNISATWPEGADYSSLKRELKNINPSKETKKHDFSFPLSGGRVYTTLSDFRNPQAREAMKQYLGSLKQAEACEKTLRELRMKWHSQPAARPGLGKSIAEAEQKAVAMRSELKQLRNKIYSLEK